MAKDEKIQYSIIRTACKGITITDFVIWKTFCRTLVRQILTLFIIVFPFNYADAEQIQTESGLFLVEIHIEKGGLKIGRNKPIKLILRDSSGNPIEGAFIKATPWCAEQWTWFK